MDPGLYRLGGMTNWPSPPTHWSFSALTLFGICPRRWGLTYAEYENAPTPYPQIASSSAITGELVHFLLEHFGKELKNPAERSVDEIRRNFDARGKLKSYIHMVRTDLRQRLTENALRRVSFDDCINTFKRITAEWSMESEYMPREASPPTPTPRQAAELLIRLDNPRILGRIDAVRDGNIIDFKTGAADAQKHADQIWLYGLLYWRHYGVVPEMGTLIYTNAEDVVITFTSEGLHKVEEKVAFQIDSADTAIKAGSFPARINEMCPRCPVRHMCPEYWKSRDTAGNRVTATAIASAQESRQPIFADAEVFDLLRTANQNVVKGRIAEFGEVYLPAPVIGGNVNLAKVLNARVSIRADSPIFSVTSNTEIFWSGASD
jgi:hypothetical protein